MTLTLDTKYQVTANDKYWKLSLFINDLILKKLIVLEDLKIWNNTIKYVEIIEIKAQL